MEYVALSPVYQLQQVDLNTRFSTSPPLKLHRNDLSVSVLRLDEIGEGLGLLDLLGVVVVVVVLRANEVHLVNTAALGASLDGAVLSNL